MILTAVQWISMATNMDFSDHNVMDFCGLCTMDIMLVMISDKLLCYEVPDSSVECSFQHYSLCCKPAGRDCSLSCKF